MRNGQEGGTSSIDQGNSIMWEGTDIEIIFYNNRIEIKPLKSGELSILMDSLSLIKIHQVSERQQVASSVYFSHQESEEGKTTMEVEYGNDNTRTKITGGLLTFFDGKEGRPSLSDIGLLIEENIGAFNKQKKDVVDKVGNALDGEIH